LRFDHCHRVGTQPRVSRDPCQTLGHRLRHRHTVERIVVVAERVLGGDRQLPETALDDGLAESRTSEVQLPFARLIAASRKPAARTKIGVSGAAIGARTLLFRLVLWLSHQSRTCVSSR
jgi:hypothetical protein